MHTKRMVKLSCLAVIASAASGLSAAPALAGGPCGNQLCGAGSTLVAPLEGEWGTTWGNQNNVTVTYQAVGSGTGLKDIAQGLVDFAGSDAPLSASTTPCNNCLQIPWALSATGIGFNVPGVHRLHLTGRVLGDIYLGKITNWSDRRITSLNRGTRFPNLHITPFHRLDGSGDTYAFADYESRVNGDFGRRIGRGVSLSWPDPHGARGNSGMVSALQSTSGAIAYVAVSYLLANNMPAAAIRNAAGRYEVPNFNNIANAAAGARRIPSNNEIHIVNPPRSQRIAYPISTFTYVIAPSNAPQGGLLRAFIGWCLGPGQAFGPRLDFVPIPRRIKNAGLSTLSRIQ